MTLSRLYEEYYELCHGRVEPTELRIGRNEYSEFRELCRKADLSKGIGPFYYETFMNAKIVFDPEMEGHRFTV